MEIITGVTLYKCDHCKKEYKRKNYCTKHEKRCYRNPENFRPCWACKHFGKRSVEVQISGSDCYGEEIFGDRNVHYCSKFQTFLQSPQTILKGNAYDLQDLPVQYMPVKCEHSVDQWSEFMNDIHLDF